MISYEITSTSNSAGKENGYVGLVGSNSISQGVSREASLQYITQNGGYIHDAISTQVWSGEAAVHVSIVNWSKQKLKEIKLDHALVSFISSSLKENTDVVNAFKLQDNMNYCFQGIEPAAKGFFVSELEVDLWKKANPKNKKVLKLLVSADDLTKEVNGSPSI